MNLKKSFRLLYIKSVGLYINVLSVVQPKKALQLSYALFTNPKIGKLTNDQLPETLKNTIKETFQHNEHLFQTYTWEGNDTKILLVHGWESNSARWEKILPYLQKSGSTIIALDAPAHGQSSGKEFNVPRYAEFIDKVVQKHKPSIIIGHSIGGTACIYHQYLHPESSIKKMVILGTPSDLKILISNFIKTLSLNRKMFAILEKRYLKNSNLNHEDFSGATFAKEIQIEGIIAHDTTDSIIAYEEGQKIASGWKNGKFITTKDLGHSMHDDKLYQEIYQFLFEK